MWDFINIFTAEANKQKSLGARIEIQKNAGKLSKWIIDNMVTISGVYTYNI